MAGSSRLYINKEKVMYIAKTSHTSTVDVFSLRMAELLNDLAVWDETNIIAIRVRIESYENGQESVEVNNIFDERIRVLEFNGTWRPDREYYERYLTSGKRTAHEDASLSGVYALLFDEQRRECTRALRLEPANGLALIHAVLTFREENRANKKEALENEAKRDNFYLRELIEARRELEER